MPATPHAGPATSVMKGMKSKKRCGPAAKALAGAVANGATRSEVTALFLGNLFNSGAPITFLFNNPGYNLGI